MSSTMRSTTATATLMRAATYRRFGGPDVVFVHDIPRPAPRADELLIKVHASTVSAADHRARSKDVPRGLGPLTALSLGIFSPRRRVLGMDVAGIVESVGADVTSFRPGDEVIAMLGSRFGGHAEYVTVSERGAVARKPRNMGFEDAAALVFGGITAQAFLKRANVRPGSTVLVTGASGAVGTAAVQLARHAGATVTAVCRGVNADLVGSLGAERVIDYTKVDFTEEGRTYDVIVDCAGTASFDRVGDMIAPGGTLLAVITDLGGLLTAGVRSRRSGKHIVVGDPGFTASDLRALSAFAESGALRPVVDRVFALADIAEAHRYVDAGKRGSVVLRIAA